MEHKAKVVFDTNIYISAIIFGGNPRTCLELARSRKIELFVSREILVELADKLRSKFFWEEEDIRDVIEGIMVFATLVSPREKVTIIHDDISDNIILACAKEAKAQIIISGDKKHLLSLEKFEKIPIIPAKTFLDQFYNN